jgi:hypothetical protein
LKLRTLAALLPIAVSALAASAGTLILSRPPTAEELAEALLRPPAPSVSPGDLLVAAGADGVVRVDPQTGAFGWVVYDEGLHASDVIAAPSGAIYVSDEPHDRIVRVVPGGTTITEAEGLSGVLGLDPDGHLVVSNADGAFIVYPGTGWRSKPLAVSNEERIHTDAFGAAFASTVAAVEIRRLDLAAITPPNPALQAPRPRARSSSGFTGYILIVPNPPLDVAVASHRELLWLESTVGIPVRVHRNDAVVERSETLDLEIPSPDIGFLAVTLAAGPAGDLYLTGRPLREANDTAEIRAYRPDGSFDRVLLTEADLPASMEAYGWNLAVVPSAEPPQAVDCSDALASLLPKAVASDASAALRCLERHVRGKTSAADCTAAALADGSAAQRRAFASERAQCLPGASGAATIGAAARGAVASLLAGLFGELDAALATRAGDPATAACQKAAAAAAARCVRARIASFERCRAIPRWTSNGPLLDAAAFAECFAAGEQTCDPTRIAPRLRRCAAVDVPAAFPACGAADASGLALCAAEQVECAACRALEAVHGVPDACAEACPAAP